MRLSTKKTKNRGGLNFMTKDEKLNSFDFLRKHALELGAADAKIIPVKKIVIEDRVVFKCQLGCEKYGKTLACPPYAPTPEKFRKIVSEYQYAMFMKFESQAEAEPELIKYLTKKDDQTIPKEIKTKVEDFWAAWKIDNQKMRNAVIKLEKLAAEKGYILATGLVSGSCTLCEKCNVEKGICVNPTLRRFSEEGVGVDVKGTAEKAGMKFTLPFKKNPETYALLLID
jgi:predicted metal-binding protein